MSVLLKKLLSKDNAEEKKFTSNVPSCAEKESQRIKYKLKFKENGPKTKSELG